MDKGGGGKGMGSVSLRGWVGLGLYIGKGGKVDGGLSSPN